MQEINNEPTNFGSATQASTGSAAQASTESAAQAMDSASLMDSAVPSLTLDPFGDTNTINNELAAAQAAADEAEAKAKAEALARTKAQSEVQKVVLDESSLSPTERKMVNDFADKIDVSNSSMIMQYGASAQQKIANFSDSALANVRTKDFGEVGSMLTNLIGELKGFNEEEEQQKGIFGFFKKTQNKIDTMKVRYDKAEVSVNSICEMLEKHQITLLKDVAMLDKMYDMNLAYFKELTMYIIAGKKRLQKERETTLIKMTEKASSGLPEDAQAVNDFAAMCDRFEKKLYDLELTRMISVQMSPQIRMVQNNDTMMAEKIQSTIVNTIPLWKSQMVISLGLAHSAQAVEAQRAVTDMTNSLLKKNAEALKIGTVGVARESERGVVDIETLSYTNQQLISTLDEVKQIQDEGRQKRRDAEVELRRIEGELRTKLLQINK